MPKIKRNSGLVRECQVCVKTIGRYAHSVVCPSCAYESCPKCLKTYLAQVPGGVMKCMNCPINFTPEFVEEALGSTFLKKEHRKLREDALFDIQLALIPNTMAFIDFSKEKKEIEDQIAGLTAQKADLQAQIYDINSSIQSKRLEIETIDAKIKSDATAASSKPAKSLKCLNTECNGAMTFKDADDLMCCSACVSSACVHCHVLFRSAAEQDNHICDPNLIASVNEIMTSSKPCPGCGYAIYRTEGCNVMFCTQCHTPFDWVTGAAMALDDDVHNPHFYDWIDENPDMAEAFENGRLQDVVQVGANPAQQCGPPDLSRIIERFRNNAAVRREVSAMHMITLHVHSDARDLSMAIQAHTNQDVSNRDLRMKYILKEIDSREFKRELYIRERINSKRVACFQLYDMFYKVMCDFLHKLVREPDSTPTLREANSLLEYFNKNSRDIAKRFQSKTLVIRPNWSI